MATKKTRRSGRTATRIEKDSMGTMEVPADVLYGATTQRAVLNFPISHTDMGWQTIHAFAQLKHAAATANQKLGKLDQRRCGRSDAPARGS